MKINFCHYYICTVSILTTQCKPVTSKDVAAFFHHYLMSKEYRKRIDFSDQGAKKLWDYDEKGVSKLISTMPMTKWSGSSKGLISYQDDIFKLELEILKEDEEILYHMTKYICEYRLHIHFERKAGTSNISKITV